MEIADSTGEGIGDLVIHDISTAGMLVETPSRLRMGQAVKVCLPEAGNVGAKIVWQDAPLFGCRFDQSLSQGIVSALRLRNAVHGQARVASPRRAAAMPEPLPERLRRLRKARGLSQADLSMLTGVSKTTIWCWETGKARPRDRNALILADLFGISTRQLYHGDLAAADQMPAAVALAGPFGSLDAVIQQAKTEIAREAGIDASQIHIHIQF